MTRTDDNVPNPPTDRGKYTTEAVAVPKNRSDEHFPTQVNSDLLLSESLNCSTQAVHCSRCWYK